MKEVFGDLFELAKGSVLVITTNGMIKHTGTAVMGRGCARQAADIWPHFPRILGDAMKVHGNVVMCHPAVDLVEPFLYHAVVTFPVKHNWWEEADIELIRQSAEQLQALVDSEGWNCIYVPKPGCGNGKLNWDSVKPIIAKYFDDRFMIVDFKRA